MPGQGGNTPWTACSDGCVTLSQPKYTILTATCVHNYETSREHIRELVAPPHTKLWQYYSAFPTDPKSSIFSLTVALIASAPGARSLRGSNPLPSRSFPASIYLRVASANESWHSVLTLILDTPRSIAFLIMSAGIPVPP